MVALNLAASVLVGLIAADFGRAASGTPWRWTRLAWWGGIGAISGGIVGLAAAGAVPAVLLGATTGALTGVGLAGSGDQVGSSGPRLAA